MLSFAVLSERLAGVSEVVTSFVTTVGRPLLMVRGLRVGGFHKALLQRGHKRWLVLRSEVGFMFFA